MKALTMKTLLAYIAFLTISTAYAAKPAARALHQPAQSVQTATAKYQVEAVIIKIWNGSAWVNSDKLTYTYNSNGLLIYDLDQIWNSNTWLNNATDTFLYDAMNRQVLHISTGWADSLKSFIYESKATNLFSGNINTTTNYGWNSSSWIPEYRDMIYSYNAHDTLDINQVWSNNAWINSQKTDSILNSKGTDSLSYISIWMSGKWYITDKYEFYCDLYGNDTLFTHLHGDSLQDLSLTFEQETKYTYNGSQITQLIQKGSYNNVSWFAIAEYYYSYDANGNDTQTTLDTGSTLSNYLIYSYAYSTTTGVQQVDTKPNATIYPNPMVSTATFEITVSSAQNARLDIININGNLVETPRFLSLETGKNSFAIARNQLPSGTYFVALSGEGVSITNKLVVE